MPYGHHPVYSFGPYLLDPDDHLLARAGRELYLRPKTFDTLCLLIEKRNTIVTREDLLESVWQGAVVSESVVAHSISEARRVLADDPEYPTYIKTIPKVGYKFIGSVTVPGATTSEQIPLLSGLSPSQAPRILAGLSPTLVERDTELKNLDLWIANLECGRGGCLLLAGERGIGKSRLLGEAVLMAATRNINVANGCCYDRAAPAYLPFDEILRSLVKATPAPPWKEKIQNSLTLGRLLCDIKFPSRDHMQLAPEDIGKPYRMATLLEELLTAQSQQKPILITLEDLHWADEGSLIVLERLASAALSTPLLILGTVRNGGSATHPLLNTLERLCLGHLAEIWHLAPLSQKGVEQWWNSIAEPIPPNIAKKIWELSHGLPLFVEETGLYCLETFGANPSAWNPQQIGSLDFVVPKRIRLFVETTLESISALGREFLTSAALAGNEFQSEETCRALGRTEDGCLEIVEELLEARLIEPSNRQTGCYRFDLPFLRSTILAKLSPARRGVLERKLDALSTLD